MNATIKSPNYQDKKYSIKWKEENGTVWLVFILNNGIEHLFEVAENAKNLEEAKRLTIEYLMKNEDVILRKEIEFKKKDLL
jgi:hypothetical protein